MGLTAHRIFKSKYSGVWFDGEGAYRFGGRWNTPGTRIMYTASTLPLALLEMLVHLEEEEMTPEYSSATIMFDEKFVVDVADFAELPSNWSGPTISPVTQAIGDEWARRNRSVVLRVPNAIIRNEFNYLINIGHDDFSKLNLGTIEMFIFDRRLIAGKRSGTGVTP